MALNPLFGNVAPKQRDFSTQALHMQVGNILLVTFTDFSDERRVESTNFMIYL